MPCGEGFPGNQEKQKQQQQPSTVQEAPPRVEQTHYEQVHDGYNDTWLIASEQSDFESDFSSSSDETELETADHFFNAEHARLREYEQHVPLPQSTATGGNNSETSYDSDSSLGSDRMPRTLHGAFGYDNSDLDLQQASSTDGEDEDDE